MKLRFCSAFLLSLLLLGGLVSSEALSYPDVPVEHWSAADVSKATDYGLMEGYENGIFGFGDRLTRASFVTILARMFHWDCVTPETPSYSDCQTDDWYYSAVETALLQGVADSGMSFRPEASITRSEMAVMLVKALGYGTLSDTAATVTCPFSDVTQNTGYITLAYDIGMTNGVAAGDGTWAFLPNDSAKREEAAAMLVRVYERYISKTDWLHGFYAFSSYGQIGLTSQMDAVSVGWSRISVDPITGPWLNTSPDNGNEWSMPNQSDLATDYFRGNGTPYNLNVYASVWDSVTLADGTVTNAAAAILSTEESRAQTIRAISAAADAYAGITIDFEGMKASLREEFTAFMTQLRGALPESKTLYVCVQPDTWFDGFDYRALGELCDKVILMAHDYQWSSIPSYYVGTQNTDCPVTPFSQVYLALRAVSDKNTGVQDRSKLALAISFSSTGFMVDGEGRLLSQDFYNPTPDVIIRRLRQETTLYSYSERYRNPCIRYIAEDGSRYLLWYEDEQSVEDKLQLAKMFSVTGVSLWRLGNIPAYSDEGLHYNVWNTVLSS